MTTLDEAKIVAQIAKDKITRVTRRHLGNEEVQLVGELDQVKDNFLSNVMRGSRMRSRGNSYTATVVTVNRQSTGALISLGAYVDGEASNTSLRVGTTWPGEVGDPLHFDAAWMTTCDIARAAIFVIQLLEAKNQWALARFKAQFSTWDLPVIEDPDLVATIKVGVALLVAVAVTDCEHSSIIVMNRMPFENWTEVPDPKRLTGAAFARPAHRCRIIATEEGSYLLQAVSGQKALGMGDVRYVPEANLPTKCVWASLPRVDVHYRVGGSLQKGSDMNVMQDPRRMRGES
jgi:hypothetical protein